MRRKIGCLVLSRFFETKQNFHAKYDIKYLSSLEKNRDKTGPCLEGFSGDETNFLFHLEKIRDDTRLNRLKCSWGSCLQGEFS